MTQPVSKRPPRIRTDLGVVRQIVDYAEATSVYRAAKDFRRDTRTVTRWVRRHRETGWPTAEDIAAWRADDAARAAERDRGRRRLAAYRKQRILNRGPLTVPITGTRRRLRALQALGWTAQQIADRLGVTDAAVHSLLTSSRARVTLATARKVAAVYDRLCMRVPGQGWVHERTRREAARKGWAPPLAWDEDSIDDPAATPEPWTGETLVHRNECDMAVVWRLVETGERVRRLTRQEAVEAFRLLRLQGLSMFEIEQRYGLAPGRYRAVDPTRRAG